MKGRKPKPAALRLIEGNREHRPIKTEPRPIDHRPKCPKFLTGEWRKAFRFICQELEGMDLLYSADALVITALAVVAGDLVEAKIQFHLSGSKYVVEGQQSQYIRIMHRCVEKIAKLSAQLALDPTARARLTMPELRKRSLREELMG